MKKVILKIFACMFFIFLSRVGAYMFPDSSYYLGAACIIFIAVSLCIIDEELK